MWDADACKGDLVGKEVKKTKVQKPVPTCALPGFALYLQSSEQVLAACFCNFHMSSAGLVRLATVFNFTYFSDLVASSELLVKPWL
jgi:hypothetical protein